MKLALILMAAALGAGAAFAKMPPPNDEAKAKAAEAAAKAKWSDQVAAFKLCQVQDKIAAQYRAQAQKDGKQASAPAGTPPCNDPGPFAYTPPADKPLEASGAHSPAGTGQTPPSTPAPQAPGPKKL